MSNTTDVEFLTWLRDRLIYVYGENPNVDFIWRLREIIEKLEKPLDKTENPAIISK